MLTKLWMQQDVIQITAETSIAEAKEIIERYNFRHLPVTEGKGLLGIISRTDINKALPSPVDASITPEDRIIAAQTKVLTFMTSNPITAGPMDPLEDVALLFRKHKIGAIPVVEDGNIIGIITTSDIFAAFSAIMAGEGDDVRIELQTDKTGNAVYTIMDICKRCNICLNSFSIYRNFSAEQQLITIRVSGTDIDTLIDSLWSSGVKVNQVSRKSGE